MTNTPIQEDWEEEFDTLLTEDEIEYYKARVRETERKKIADWINDEDIQFPINIREISINELAKLINETEPNLESLDTPASSEKK